MDASPHRLGLCPSEVPPHHCACTSSTSTVSSGLLCVLPFYLYPSAHPHTASCPQSSMQSLSHSHQGCGHRDKDRDRQVHEHGRSCGEGLMGGTWSARGWCESRLQVAGHSLMVFGVQGGYCSFSEWRLQLSSVLFGFAVSGSCVPVPFRVQSCGCCWAVPPEGVLAEGAAFLQHVVQALGSSSSSMLPGTFSPVLQRDGPWSLLVPWQHQGSHVSCTCPHTATLVLPTAVTDKALHVPFSSLSWCLPRSQPSAVLSPWNRVAQSALHHFWASP